MTDDEKKLIGIDRELLDITTRAEAIRDAAIESGDADDGIVEVLAIDIWRAVDRIRVGLGMQRCGGYEGVETFAEECAEESAS